MTSNLPEAGDHAGYLRLCLELAQESPPLPSNFRVGAALVHEPSNTILSTGYTNERPGNTHAEQVCIIKLAEMRSVGEQDLGSIPEMAQGQVVLYTTVEPCMRRLSGNTPCLQRILDLQLAPGSGVLTVYVGVREPDTFVQGNNAEKALGAAGIRFVHVPGMEKEILQVATAGHK